MHGPHGVRIRVFEVIRVSLRLGGGDMTEDKKTGRGQKRRGKKTASRRSSEREATYPSGVHALMAIGAATEQAIKHVWKTVEGQSLFEATAEGDLKKLAGALAESWDDEHAAFVVTLYAQAFSTGTRVNITSLCRWVLSHPNDPDAVQECMTVKPPEGIDVIRVLSRAGSQKLVFLATWRLAQRQVVLKQVIGPPEARAAIMQREALSHPLSLEHPNIIETHFLTNTEGEPFLVEERLPHLLNDEWRSSGVHEAANLLRDIADALNYLHGRLDLVHGDVKPDNIGQRGEDYILLDFGICRPATAFTADTSATGSLRTRAPELLMAEGYIEPEKVDVWALGATVFNAIAGRYPLFDMGEKPPRVSHLKERGDFETLLCQRVENEWSERVSLDAVDPPVDHVLRDLLGRALHRKPAERVSAGELLETVELELAPHVRARTDTGRFSPLDELRQLVAFLPEARILGLMPATRTESLKARLRDLAKIKGLPAEEREQIGKLSQRLGG